jgi:hypothetical protein
VPAAAWTAAGSGWVKERQRMSSWGLPVRPQGSRPGCCCWCLRACCTWPIGIRSAAAGAFCSVALYRRSHLRRLPVHKATPQKALAASRAEAQTM